MTTDQKHLETLAHRANTTAKLAVLDNPVTNAETVEFLTGDKDPVVADKARARLADPGTWDIQRKAREQEAQREVRESFVEHAAEGPPSADLTEQEWRLAVLHELRATKGYMKSLESIVRIVLALGLMGFALFFILFLVSQ